MGGAAAAAAFAGETGKMIALKRVSEYPYQCITEAVDVQLTSGVRLGTPAVTTRGLKEADMDVIAECIHLCATDFDNKADAIRAKVTELLSKYPLYND